MKIKLMYLLLMLAGFGMKIFNYPEYVLTLAAAKITKKTVKWTAKKN